MISTKRTNPYYTSYNCNENKQPSLRSFVKFVKYGHSAKIIPCCALMWHIFLLTLPAYLKRNAYERNVPKPDNPLLAHHQLDHGILSTPQVVQSVPLPIPLEIGLQLMYIARPTGSEQTLFPTWNGLRKYSVRQKREKHQLHITQQMEGVYPLFEWWLKKHLKSTSSPWYICRLSLAF